MSCYFLAQITIHNATEYQTYLDGFDAVFDKFGGAVVAVDDAPALLEGDWPRARVVLIRFPDEGEARRWYDSPQYQKLAAYRRRAASANIMLIKGRE